MWERRLPTSARPPFTSIHATHRRGGLSGSECISSYLPMTEVIIDCVFAERAAR